MSCPIFSLKFAKGRNCSSVWNLTRWIAQLNERNGLNVKKKKEYRFSSVRKEERFERRGGCLIVTCEASRVHLSLLNSQKTRFAGKFIVISLPNNNKPRSRQSYTNLHKLAKSFFQSSLSNFHNKFTRF